VCADTARRREALEQVIGGVVHAVTGEEDLRVPPPALVSWDDLLNESGLASRFQHLLALDPPLDRNAVEVLASAPAPDAGLIHLAWGPVEIDYALAVARSELDLRPAVTAIYRSLRKLGEGSLEEVLEDGELGVRSPRACGRAVRVLIELSLIELSRRMGTHWCRLLEVERTELEWSQTFRECATRLASATAYLEGSPARAA